MTATTKQWDAGPSQLKFFNAHHPRNLFCGGWGSGKSLIGSRKAALRSIQYPNSLGLISANTVRQLHHSTLSEFWKVLRRDYGLSKNEDYVFNKQPPKRWGVQSSVEDHDGVLTYRWGAQVVVRSLHHYEAIEGLNLDWAWIDEAWDAKQEAIQTVISRLRGKNTPSPELDVTTRPNGYDYIWEFFKDKVDKNPELEKERWRIQGSTFENAKYLADGYIDGLLNTLSTQQARQMIYAEWINIHSGRCYKSFDETLNVRQDAVYNSMLPVWLTCDFNVDPMSWLVCQPWHGRKLDDKLLQPESLAVVDEIVIPDSTTQEAINEFRSRGYGDAPHRVTVFGDAAGNSRSTSGFSDYLIIKNAGFRNFDIPNADPRQIDRINATNGKLGNANGVIGVVINPQCHELITDLSQVGYKLNTRSIDKADPKRTHTSDALGYLIYRKWPIRSLNTIKVVGDGF